jgi:prepilin-type N-terminal cleavage/methylation domain-containing protein
MQLGRKNKNIQKGFSIIEVLISLSIMVVAFVSFYKVSSFGTKYIIDAKNKMAAVAFANEEMETIRNLSYDKVGTQGSIDIPGNLLQEQDVVANGKTYQVSIDVRYFDDPMDGTITSTPADLIPNDYKIVKVIISWADSNGQTKSVSSSSRFVPPGLETSVGGSPLSINVIDGETLLPVSQAAVNIKNTSVTPTINDTINTDSNGYILLPSARISNGDKVTITKSGYETIETMDASSTFTPIYGHINVIAGFLNSYNFIQNKLADLTVNTVDYQDNPIGNIQFSISGGKIIGHDNLGANVFSMVNTAGTTDPTEGKKKYSNISSGNYDISTAANVQYQVIDYDPSTTPFFLAPGSDSTYKIRLADKNIDALFLEVDDSESPAAPIAGAKVTLSKNGTDIFTDKLSSLRGIVFYPDGSDSLTAGNYDLKIEADGYTAYNGSVDVNKLTHEVVHLVKN